jgi:hypothetical protein
MLKFYVIRELQPGLPAKSVYGAFSFATTPHLSPSTHFFALNDLRAQMQTSLPKCNSATPLFSIASEHLAQTIFAKKSRFFRVFSSFGTLHKTRGALSPHSHSAQLRDSAHE